MQRKLLKLIKDYQTPLRAIEIINQAKVVFLVGISGAGKDTILKHLLNTGKYRLIVSHTTRKPRLNQGVLEQDGRDYHFIDFSQAELMLENREFVEAKVYSNNIYGTSIAEIDQASQGGKIAISDIEVQGVAEYKSFVGAVMPIFILPPNYDVWQKRLLSRYQNGQIDEQDIQKRKQTAKLELEEALNRDYFQFVVNDDLGNAVKSVDKVAHGEFSQAKNRQAKKVAEMLLTKLN